VSIVWLPFEACVQVLYALLISVLANEYLRRREREQKKAAGAQKKKTKKRKATKAKKATPAKKKKAPAKKEKAESESEEEEGEEDEDEDDPDVSGDVALAQSLAGKRVSARNMDKKGKQFKKQAALAKIREVRFVWHVLSFAFTLRF